jgi:hypothetical protein
MTCPQCGGRGEIRDLKWEEWDPCKLCEATGEVECGAVFDNIGDSNTLVFKFPTREAALCFKAYMSDGGGEQPFLEAQKSWLEDGDLKPEEQVEKFIYHTGDNTILVK